ncbi:MAG: S1C family serine protease [Dehalococcoidia bacterium]
MQASTSAAGGLLAALSGELAQVTRRVQASVVEVHTRGHGAGAGTIWNPNGTIVTNHHVTPGDGARVRLADGREFTAATVARDAENDLVVLHIDAVGLPAATIGDARTLRPGEIVLAVGHPFGVKAAVTVGVVSAAHAGMQGDHGTQNHRELVRADVTLGPGNSGGPLADAQGRVVGINSMVNGGMALAVPSHLVERLLGRRGGRRTLGVAVRDVELPAAMVAAAQLRSAHAALVVGVAQDSPAERAGVLIGDVITGIGGSAVESAAGLVEALARLDDGPAQLRLLRGGEPRVIAVPLIEHTAQNAA